MASSESTNHGRTWVSLVFVLAVLLSGCAPNDLSIRLAFSRLDNSISQNINDYAEFNEDQQAWIRQQSRNYQLWMRETQLPIYADLMESLANDLNSGDEITHDYVESYFLQLRKLSRNSFQELPLSHSVETLKSLSDDQIIQIENHMQSLNEEQLERILQQEHDGSNATQIDRMNKSLSRIGITLTEEQKNIIDQGLNQYVGSRQDRVLAWEKWQNMFVALLEERDRPGFDDRMYAHITTYQSQMELQYPERTLQNTQITIDTIVKIGETITLDQRETLIRNLRKTSSVFRDMAQSKQTTIL